MAGQAAWCPEAHAAAPEEAPCSAQGKQCCQSPCHRPTSGSVPAPLPAEQVAADSKFVDLGADSLDTVEIMMAL